MTEQIKQNPLTEAIKGMWQHMDWDWADDDHIYPIKGHEEDLQVEMQNVNKLMSEMGMDTKYTVLNGQVREVPKEY